MMLWGIKQGAFGKLVMKRWFRVRGSDKNKRVHDRLSKYRKTWWHFKTRWDPKDDNTEIHG